MVENTDLKSVQSGFESLVSYVTCSNCHAAIQKAKHGFVIYEEIMDYDGSRTSLRNENYVFCSKNCYKTKKIALLTEKSADVRL